MEGTFKFDPENVCTVGDLANEANISNTAAREWVGRNRERIPEPVFTLVVARRGSGVADSRMPIWTPVQMAKIIETYWERKAVYDARIKPRTPAP